MTNEHYADMGVYLRTRDAKSFDISELRAYALEYIRRNPNGVILGKRKPLLLCEENHVADLMVRLMTGDFTPGSFLGNLANGVLSAVTHADETALRCIKLLMWFEHNEASGIRR